jgi:hypothetical protein
MKTHIICPYCKHDYLTYIPNGLYDRPERWQCGSCYAVLSAREMLRVLVDRGIDIDRSAGQLHLQGVRTKEDGDAETTEEDDV